MYEKFIAECDTCQRNKNENVMAPGLLHPLHIPNQKREEISMDFIEGLPMSNGKDKIFVVVDRLTKYAHFMAARKTDSTKQIADVFAKTFINCMGFRRSLSAIGMQNLKEIFGEIFANKLEYPLIQAQPTIRKFCDR
jgi:hypothetical protein